MHSSQYTRLAQAADNFSFSIVGAMAMPADEGTYPAAHCLLFDDSRPVERAWAVGMGVLPIEAGREAYFSSVTYDLSREQALARFNHAVAGNAERIGEVESNDLLRIRML